MEISSRLIRRDILYFLYFTTLIASVAISWRLALVTYIPVNLPVFFPSKIFHFYIIIAQIAEITVIWAILMRILY